MPKIKYDGSLNIAVGLGANSRSWKNKKTTWTEFIDRIKQVQVTGETFKEYIAATKAEQLKIKDVGGYVGGYLRNGRRKPEHVVNRQLITLDIDFAHMNFWDDFQMLCPNAAIIHSTHKHNENSPRLRLIMPIDREVTSDEYVAISRKVAGDFGIDLFDNTTFETNRLMFWPSVPRDIDYFFDVQDGPWIEADEVLKSYLDWTDSSLWPTSSRELNRVKNITDKQEDPENKKGIVGAFCRSYTIQDAIDKYLPDIYTYSGDDRYTYSKGTTTAGLMIYDDKFAYSHHGTDPTSGRLCNAFDLVRIHNFGYLDDQDSVNEKSQSFIKMAELASQDPKVKKIIATENIENAKYEFADELESEVDDIDWMVDLETDRRNKYLSSAVNLRLIFENDPRLKNLFKTNQFDGKKYVFGSLPWRKVSDPEPLKNVDLSGLRVYIETMYGIVSGSKIDDALALAFEKNSFHPIREYINKLDWDGKKRIDTLLIEYFGAEDNIYTREAIRKPLVGAVARVFNPGVKFDYVLTLVGPQGCGKSTFFKKLGRQWFSDTFLTVQGKEALEQIQGAWLIEMAELSGLRKAEVEAVKHFITKQEDSFRPAYARTSETYKRQCVFFGSTNNRDFLTDPTGNRRFLPVDIKLDRIISDVFEDLTEEDVDQIWAEAYQLFRKKELLKLSDAAEEIAKQEQKNHSEVDERAGIIEDFLDTKLPKNWSDLGPSERSLYLEVVDEQNGTETRNYVCIAEIWCECLGKNRVDMSRYNTRDLNNILRAMEDWEPSTSTRFFELYGKQKYYQRKIHREDFSEGD